MTSRWRCLTPSPWQCFRKCSRTIRASSPSEAAVTSSARILWPGYQETFCCQPRVCSPWKKSGKKIVYEILGKVHAPGESACYRGKCMLPGKVHATGESVYYRVCSRTCVLLESHLRKWSIKNKVVDFLDGGSCSRRSSKCFSFSCSSVIPRKTTTVNYEKCKISKDMLLTVQKHNHPT